MKRKFVRHHVYTESTTKSRLDNYSDLNLSGQNELAIKLGFERGDAYDEFYKNPCTNTLKRISKLMQTSEMVMAAIENDTDRYSVILSCVSKKLLDKKICLSAVTKNGVNLKYVPQNIIDKEICNAAIFNNVATLKYVPNEHLTESLCDYAINIDGLAIAYIPQKYITGERIEAAIKNSKPDKNQWPIAHIPSQLMSQEWADLSFKLFPESISAIPSKYVNEKMCIKAVEFDGLLLKKIPIKYRKMDSVIEKAIASNKAALMCVPLKYEKIESLIDKVLISNPLAIEYVPSKYKTKDRCFNAIAKDSSVSINWFPKKIKKEYESIYDSESNNGKESIQRFADYPLMQLPIPKLQNSEQIVDNPNKIHDLVLGKSDNAICVYYATDIHIEHQIKINNCTINGLRKKIDNKIKEMIKDITEPHGILLIGGDIADSLEVSSIFYERLKRLWDGKIIAVLGNHELWDIPRSNLNCSIDSIVEDYKKMAKDNWITLLENELLIRYKRNWWGKISEKELIDAKESDLSQLCDCSDIIILGGIGFSGLNPKYNANTGLYSNRLSSEEDCIRSERFNEIYNKIVKCAGEKRVVVLSHMPMPNWSPKDYNPNWIYVSGHTHHNHAQILKEGAILLSDNQIGYEPRKWHLKSFVFDESYQTNIFKNVKDGIYKISASEYINFCRDNGIALWEFKRSGQIYLLKRDGNYMFLLKYNKLYLLEGGRLKSIIHDEHYYYDNLSRYCDNVKKGLGAYYSYLKIVSDEIKKIGGIGTIHGCIVDIDFWNHMYVNPYDGKISSYYALDQDYKLFYKNLSELLCNSLKPPKCSDGELILNRFKSELSKGEIPILGGYDCDSDFSFATVPELILDREMYKPSAIMKSFQYVIENNIVRIWRDDILNASFDTTGKIGGDSVKKLSQS